MLGCIRFQEWWWWWWWCLWWFSLLIWCDDVTVSLRWWEVHWKHDENLSQLQLCASETSQDTEAREDTLTNSQNRRTTREGCRMLLIKKSYTSWQPVCQYRCAKFLQSVLQDPHRFSTKTTGGSKCYVVCATVSTLVGSDFMGFGEHPQPQANSMHATWYHDQTVIC